MANISFNFNLFNPNYFFYERLVVLLFSLVPTLLLVAFVLFTDRNSKEPTKNIIICLLSGFLTIALSGYFEELVIPYFSNSMILTYVFGMIEEIAKISIFFLFIFDNKYYDDIYDGIVYMALIALSFAGLENVLYAFRESTVTSSINLSIMRDFTTIPLHVICGIVIGYFASLSNFSKNKTKKYINIVLAIVISSFIHGTYNNLMSLLASLKINPGNVFQILIFQTLPLLLIMVVLFIIAVKVVKKSIRLDSIYMNNEKFEPKYLYLMTYSEYVDSNDRRKRINMYNKTKFKKEMK